MVILDGNDDRGRAELIAAEALEVDRERLAVDRDQSSALLRQSAAATQAARLAQS
jgi:hypothetical protein